MKNDLTKNIKANICFGGHNSGNTVIIKNNIVGSPNFGICQIDGGNAWVYLNKISENNDGVLI